MIYGPKRGVAFVFYLPMVTRGAADWKTSPTIAAGDWKVSKDDGALANLATLPTVSPAASAWVKVSLSAAEMDAAVVKVQAIDQTGPKEWEDTGEEIVTSAVDLQDGAGAGLSRLDATVSSRAAPADVPSAASISAAVWSAAARTLTAFGFPVKLSSDGLDDVDPSVPTTKPTTFRGWVMWLIQNFRHATFSSTQKQVLRDTGEPITTQATSEAGGVQTVGPP